MTSLGSKVVAFIPAGAKIWVSMKNNCAGLDDWFVHWTSRIVQLRRRPDAPAKAFSTKMVRTNGELPQLDSHQHTGIDENYAIIRFADDESHIYEQAAQPLDEIVAVAEAVGAPDETLDESATAVAEAADQVAASESVYDRVEMFEQLPESEQQELVDAARTSIRSEYNSREERNGESGSPDETGPEDVETLT